VVLDTNVVLSALVHPVTANQGVSALAKARRMVDNSMRKS